MVILRRINLEVRYASDLEAEIKFIEKLLKFKIEGAEFSQKFRDHVWDGYHRFYTKRNQTFSYGFLAKVVAALVDKGISYKIENNFSRRVISPADITPNLWNHQKDAVIRFFQLPYGTLQIPTRGGKTKAAAEIIKLFDRVTLFVVDSQVLFEQAIVDISSHLNIKSGLIGRIQGDEFKPAPVTVAMIQTLQSVKYGLAKLRKQIKNSEEEISTITAKAARKARRTRKAGIQTFMESVSLLIVDEVHEYGNDERIKTVQLCKNATACLFLSATPRKSESELTNLKIESLASQVIYKITEQELRVLGVLADEAITLIMVDHNTEMKKDAQYRDYKMDRIVHNGHRNAILVGLIGVCKKLKINTLVLFSQIAHAEFIKYHTGELLITGATPKAERLAAVKNTFSARKPGILLATNIFNKGVTLPEVEASINAAGGLEQSNVTQKKGRTLGTTATKKKAMTIDLVDTGDYFASHSLNRIAVYEKAVGLDNIAIFDSGDPEFMLDITEHLRNWKNDV